MNERACKLTNKTKEPAKQKNELNESMCSRIVVRFELVLIQKDDAEDKV